MGDWILQWWPIISAVLGSLLGGLGMWTAWSARKQFVTHDQFSEFRDTHESAHDEVTDRFARGEIRFERLESTLADLPTKGDIADLKIQMERLGGDIRVVTAILHRVETPVRSMVEGALEAHLK
ncbi:hypothetical protein H261_11864 [Paramagnetospirillum caucaseum]|uniref:DUF2730 family protein n=1 Tax=Paramagnetospirillum caucaseum TaxID=1244869 RepID=M3AB48_9PROT|nr:DUF2730 family protein [Paramagnetospirillum caucaseum]EME69729.1 hypothetical protein H261_11864 [Paramagnetospirillum caucaseum]